MVQNLNSIHNFLRKSAEKSVGAKRFSTLASQRQESPPHKFKVKVIESIR